MQAVIGPSTSRSSWSSAVDHPHGRREPARRRRPPAFARGGRGDDRCRTRPAATTTRASSCSRARTPSPPERAGVTATAGGGATRVVLNLGRCSAISSRTKELRQAVGPGEHRHPASPSGSARLLGAGHVAAHRGVDHLVDAELLGHVGTHPDAGPERPDFRVSRLPEPFVTVSRGDPVGGRLRRRRHRTSPGWNQVAERPVLRRRDEPVSPVLGPGPVTAVRSLVTRSHERAA